MLTDDARRDKNLNAVDKNMLAILQFIEDGKSAHGEWFRILIKHPNGKWEDDNYNSIEKYFNEFEVPVVYRTLNRSVNKLLRLGYIDYRAGWYNNNTHQGMTPMVKLLKGTIPIKCGIIVTAKGNDDIESSEKLTTDKSATCSDIVTAKGEITSDKGIVNLNDSGSDSYSDIVTAYEKEKYKEKYKESYNLSTLDISDTSDISTSIGTTHNDKFKQEKTMEEKQQQKLTVVQQQKLTVGDEQEMDSRKNTIMASIERFIEKSPELDEEQVKGYIEYYAGKIKEAYHQDDANSTISTMIGRISKARLNNVPTNTPPKWMVEKADNEFKEYSVGNNHIMIGIGAYAQKVNQMLANDRKKPDYRDKVDGYKNWYLQHIIEMAAPALAKKNPDIPMEEIKRKIQAQFQKAF